MSRIIKYKCEEQFQLLANQLARANTHFYFAKKLHENYRQLSLAKDFWDYTLAAHCSIAMLDLARIYDTHKNGLNLFNSLNSIDKNFLDRSKRQVLDDYIAYCGPKTQDFMVQSLRKWRNNIIAHFNVDTAFDRESFDKNNPLEPEHMVVTLTEKGFKMLEWCSGLHGKNTTYQKFASEKESCEKVLNCLQNAKGLKHE